MPDIMNHFFAVLGKLTLFVVLIGAVGVGAYYLGTKNPSTETKKEFIVATSDALISPTTGMDATTTKETNQVSAGAAQMTPYTVAVPTDWTTKHELEKDDMDTLILSKDGYMITIYQAGMGGMMYSFPDTPQDDGPMVQSYTGTYTDFTGRNGEKYRRIDSSSQNKPGEKSFTILSKGTSAYINPTSFGAISYATPISPDKEILEEMDQIISSLQKK